jgi:hypothetical protein
MIIHNPILTGSFTVNGTDVASITSSAASLTSLNAYTASQNNRNGTYATTGSNTFAGIQTVNSNLVVTGSITAQTLVVQTVTSSVVYSSGSNVFGNNIANTQVFTGSVSMTGSLAVVTNGTEFQVTSTGVNFGNALADSHVISGSIRMNPNGLFVSGSGLVGIGTDSPATLLEVVNPTLATDTVNTLLTQRWSRKQTGAVKWGNSIDLLLGSYESGTINSRSRVDFRLANGATDTPDTTVMTLQGNGNVGIGTNAPSSAFHVRGLFGAPSTSGTTQNGIARLGQTSGNGVLDIGFGDPYSWLQSRNATDYSVNYNLALNPNGGNVGINTTTPYTKLHTNGSVGMGINSAGYPINAKLVKQSVNTVTFTVNVGTIGAWRPGYAMIRVAAAQNGLQEFTAAWFYIRVVSYFASSAGMAVVSSGGDTGSYTFSGSGTGSGTPQILTFTIADANASTDTIIADIDFSYTEGIISIS